MEYGALLAAQLKQAGLWLQDLYLAACCMHCEVCARGWGIGSSFPSHRIRTYGVQLHARFDWAAFNSVLMPFQMKSRYIIKRNWVYYILLALCKQTTGTVRCCCYHLIASSHQLINQKS